MTAVSATINITNKNFETLASLASITLTSGKTYSIQIQGIIEYKIANAIFTFENVDFTWTQSEDDVYIRTLGLPATITILENV